MIPSDIKMINREYTKDMKACGVRVALHKEERQHERQVGGIFIPEDTDMNHRMCKATVVSVGERAKQENVQPGQTVLYDTMSVYYDHHPRVVCDVQNVICLIDEDEEIPITPFGNNLLLDKIPLNDSNMGGILIPDSVEQTQYKYKVLKHGLGKVKDGKVIPFDIEVGKYILPTGEREFMFTTIKYKETDYWMLDASNVVAYVEEETEETTEETR